MGLTEFGVTLMAILKCVHNDRIERVMGILDFDLIFLTGANVSHLFYQVFLCCWLTR